MNALEHAEAIKKLKARYFRMVDTKNWASLRQVFTDDYVIDMTDAGGGRMEGADAFVAFLQEILANAVTVHLGHTPEIDVTSDEVARGVWALHDLFIVDGTRVSSYGHLFDEYRKVDGKWLIASTEITRLHMEITQAWA